MDYLDALGWVESVGGISATIERCNQNLATVANFVAERDWIDFLAEDESTRSNSSVCLSLDLSPEQVKEVVKLLDDEGVAYDIGAYRDAPAGLRIWCGATVENSNLEALMPWIDWAYQQVK